MSNKFEIGQKYITAKYYDILYCYLEPYYHTHDTIELAVDNLIHSMLPVKYRENGYFDYKKWDSFFNMEFEFTQERLDILEKHLAIKLLQK